MAGLVEGRNGDREDARPVPHLRLTCTSPVRVLYENWGVPEYTRITRRDLSDTTRLLSREGIFVVCGNFSYIYKYIYIYMYIYIYAINIHIYITVVKGRDGDRKDACPVQHRRLRAHSP